MLLLTDLEIFFFFSATIGRFMYGKTDLGLNLSHGFLIYNIRLPQPFYKTCFQNDIILTAPPMWGQMPRMYSIKIISVDFEVTSSKTVRVPSWCSRVRIWHCHCGGLGRCCGLIPGLRSLSLKSRKQKKKKKVFFFFQGKSFYVQPCYSRKNWGCGELSLKCIEQISQDYNPLNTTSKAEGSITLGKEAVTHRQGTENHTEPDLAFVTPGNLKNVAQSLCTQGSNL